MIKYNNNLNSLSRYHTMTTPQERAVPEQWLRIRTHIHTHQVCCVPPTDAVPGCSAVLQSIACRPQAAKPGSVTRRQKPGRSPLQPEFQIADADVCDGAMGGSQGLIRLLAPVRREVGRQERESHQACRARVA